MRKVLQYRLLIGSSDYKRQLGIDAKLAALTVTTNRQHMLEIMQMVRQELGQARYLFFTSLPQFGGLFRVPPLIEDLLQRSWERVGFDPFVIVGGGQ